MTNQPDRARRNLMLALGGGSIGAAAMASPALNLAWQDTGGASASWWDRLFLSLANGSVDEWRPLVGQIFSVEGESGPVQVLLGAVGLLPSKGVRPADVARRRAFALTFFAAPDRAPLGQRTYRLTNASYPALDIHLDPAVRLPRGVSLTAVFN